MSMSELAQYLPQLDIRDFCRMSMLELARHSPSSIFGTSAWLDIRPSSIFGTSVECQFQSWLVIRPSSFSGTSAECRRQS
ncbi:hypothetical protein DPMN_142086 [Dreissena polymorpha]|uniref:Uncharacterized protein n=1 Tax=Dreissena polymorpha TaxID=45954 RepID=A0A9D4JIB3_DREPO|nr:hypothetical protein DPMN_142086 [Dreissena polymorpha]